MPEKKWKNNPVIQRQYGLYTPLCKAREKLILESPFFFNIITISVLPWCVWYPQSLIAFDTLWPILSIGKALLYFQFHPGNLRVWVTTWLDSFTGKTAFSVVWIWCVKLQFSVREEMSGGRKEEGKSLCLPQLYLQPWEGVLSFPARLLRRAQHFFWLQWAMTFLLESELQLKMKPVNGLDKHSS